MLAYFNEVQRQHYCYKMISSGQPEPVCQLFSLQSLIESVVDISHFPMYAMVNYVCIQCSVTKTWPLIGYIRNWFRGQAVNRVVKNLGIQYSLHEEEQSLHLELCPNKF